MRFLILSDIHGNLEALDAVLKSAPSNSFDSVLVLGDLVGYGANPNEVIERIFALEPDVLIRGNHDRVACGLGSIEPFNGLAADAIRWTQNVLTTLNRTRLANLPVGPVTVNEQIEVCHGAPFDEDYYLTDQSDAMLALETSKRSLCFFGHTHLPIVFKESIENLHEVKKIVSVTSRPDRIKVAYPSISCKSRLSWPASGRRSESRLRHSRFRSGKRTRLQTSRLPHFSGTTKDS